LAAPLSNPACNRSAGAAALAALALGVAATAAFAYPEGAPWGAANPAADESCGYCHFGYEPVPDSAALAIEGLPETARPGERYSLVVRFTDDEAAVSGFQLLASAGHGDAGRFGTDTPGIETVGAASRSTTTRTPDEGFEWPLWWRAPATGGDIILYLAASSANDDQSPFGDRIHYRRFRVRVPAGGAKQ